MLTKRSLEDLDGSLVATAARLLERQLGMENEEARQEIWVGICKRTRQDERFLEQADAYIVQGGINYARNEWHKRRCREWRWVLEERVKEPAHDERLLDNLCSCDYLERLMRRLRGDRVATETAKGLIVGYRKKEIAQRVGVSPQSVSAAVKRLAIAVASM